MFLSSVCTAPILTKTHLHILRISPTPHQPTARSSHVVDPLLGELAITGGCPRSADLAAQQRLAFEPATAVMSAVERLYPGSTRQGSAGGTPRVTEIADALLPCKCHRSEYPVPVGKSTGTGAEAGVGVMGISTGHGASSGGGRGNGEHLLATVMTEADRSFCQRYTGDAGGREATQLGRLPTTTPVSISMTVTASMSAAIVYTDAKHSSIALCPLTYTQSFPTAFATASRPLPLS